MDEPQTFTIEAHIEVWALVDDEFRLIPWHELPPDVIVKVSLLSGKIKDTMIALGGEITMQMEVKT